MKETLQDDKFKKSFLPEEFQVKNASVEKKEVRRDVFSLLSNYSANLDSLGLEKTAGEILNLANKIASESQALQCQPEDLFLTVLEDCNE